MEIMFQIRLILPDLTSHEVKVFTIPRKDEHVDLGDIGDFIVVDVIHDIDSSIGDFHRVSVHLEYKKYLKDGVTFRKV